MMKRRFRTYSACFWAAITLCFLIHFHLLAKGYHVSSSNNGSLDETVITFNVEEFALQNVSINGEACSQINFGGGVWIQKKGFPLLPAIAKSIIIPHDAAMGLEIVSVTYTEIAVNKIVPSKGVIYRNQNPAAIPFIFGKCYMKDTWYPEDVAILGEPYIMRNMRGLTVRFQPFQYNPAREIVRVAKRITLKVKKVGAGKVNVLASPYRSISPSYDIIFRDHFANYLQDSSRYNCLADGEKMIVISASGYASAMEPLVAWKNRKGIETKLYKYPSETGGSGDVAVKSFIQGKYDSDKITYVILVGDLEDIPSPQGGGGRSDPSYTLVSGSDYYPDLFVGRFSVSSETEAEAMVNKVLKYEKEPDPDGLWYHKAVGMASNEGDLPDYEWISNFRDTLLAYNYTEVDEFYEGRGYNTEQIIAALNEGRGWFNYMGHGFTDAFGFIGAKIKNSDFEALENTDMLPVLISVACDNGQFDKNDCIAEVATLQPRKGVLAYLGSWISQSWDPPQFGQEEMVSLLCRDACISLGCIVYNGGAKILDQGSSSKDYLNTFLTWTLFGDPSIMIFTDTPDVLNVTHQSRVATGKQKLSISFGEEIDGRACLYDTANGIAGSAIISGQSSVELDADIPIVDKMTLTVTARNKMPFITEINTITEAIVRPDFLKNIELRCFPNPFSTITNISLSKPIKNALVTIYAGNGKAVVSRKVTGNNFRWDAKDQTSGLYFVKVRVNGEVFEKRICLMR